MIKERFHAGYLDSDQVFRNGDDYHQKSDLKSGSIVHYDALTKSQVSPLPYLYKQNL